MVLKCFKCFEVFLDVQKLIKHVRLWHYPVENKNMQLKCCGNGCLSIFQTFSGYRKHLSKCKLILDLETNQTFEITNKTVHPPSAESVKTITDNDLADDNLNHSSVEFNPIIPFEIIKKQLLCFVSHILSLGTPISTVSVITDYFKEILHSIFDEVKMIIPDHFQGDWNIFSNKILNLFIDNSSIYKIKKNVTKNMVKPVEVALGIRTDQVFNRLQNVHVTKNVTNTLMYVPILETLSVFLKNKSVQPFFSDPKFHVNDRNLETFSDGSNFKSSNLFLSQPNAIQIQLYFDEFECTAPLGTKTGSHKMGGLYFIIRNIPPKFLGQLENIFLAALFYSADLKTLSFNTILSPIIRDLKILESEGISVAFLPYKLKGTLVALSHDNLGGNTMYCMVESFSANYFCRFCTIHKSDTQKVFSENHNLCILRTIDFYKNIPESIQKGTNYFGIKELSILNELTYFTLSNSSSVDIMHDLLEGVVQFEIKHLLLHLTSTKIINIEEINRRIFVFNYGRIDRCTKPSPINLEKSGHNIGERAAQTWTLIRYLPLILGDLISKCDKNIWKIISLLLQIMCICFSPTVPLVAIDKLEKLIYDHHILVKRYFGHVLPKHHIMIHYPSVLRKMGPLVHLWCMRFEAKHGYFKDLVHKLKNFKNIPKTLAERHQILMCHSWNEKILKIHLTLGPSKNIAIKDSQFKKYITEELDISDNFSITQTKYINYGFMYKPTFFICTSVDQNKPTFQEILEIFLLDEIPFFIVKLWETVAFNEHLNSFLVRPLVDINIINVQLLVYREPYEVKQAQGSLEFYIVPKYIFV